MRICPVVHVAAALQVLIRGVRELRGGGLRPVGIYKAIFRARTYIHNIYTNLCSPVIMITDKGN